MRYVSPLRYPGGKGKLASFIKLIFDSNNLLDGEYVEPYAGGAAVALSLLFEEYVSKIHINDKDPSVFAFWNSVLNETDKLCRLIADTPVNMRQWCIQKKIQDDWLNAGQVALGFSTFFLNRTNRSGIIKGGVIGGKEQTGNWKIDARYNKKTLIERVQKIARFHSRIALHNEDALSFLMTVMPTLPRKSLTYLDPPYYVKGKRRLYANFYQEGDHAEVAKFVTRLRRSWIVSYDEAPEIIKLYGGRQRIVYGLSYSAADRYKGSEVMFFSDDLVIPKVSDPAKLWERRTEP